MIPHGAGTDNATQAGRDHDGPVGRAGQGGVPAARLFAPARALAAVGIALGLACAWVELAALPAVLVDLTVYQAAVRQMLAGGSLYSLPSTVGAPFLYPPFGALALIPSVLLPAPFPEAITMAVHVLCCLALALVLLVAAPTRRRGRLDAIQVFSLCALTLFATNPVVSGMYFGQVSLPIVTVMVVDQLVGQRWRGLLTGFAGAIKLWPLIMIPHYLLTRQWRAVANSTAGFAAATALGFVVAPADSLQYWSGGVPVPPTPPWLNKSWSALLHDVGIFDFRLWAAGAAVIFVVALWRAGLHYRVGQELAAVLVLGVAATQLSPLTWMHHLVWWPLTGLYLVLTGNRWQRIAGVALVAAVTIGSPLVTYLVTPPPWLGALGEVFAVGSAVLVFAGLPRHECGEPVL